MFTESSSSSLLSKATLSGNQWSSFKSNFFVLQIIGVLSACNKCFRPFYCFVCCALSVWYIMMDNFCCCQIQYGEENVSKTFFSVTVSG